MSYNAIQVDLMNIEKEIDIILYDATGFEEGSPERKKFEKRYKELSARRQLLKDALKPVVCAECGETREGRTFHGLKQGDVYICKPCQMELEIGDYRYE